MWVPQKISHICSYINFFHKILHDFKVKSPIPSIKRIELSVTFNLFQWCHDLFTVLCLSLDWKIRFNLDFVLKSFRCSKGDVWRVLLTTLRMIPQMSYEKAGLWIYKKLTQGRRYGEWTGLWQQWLVVFIFRFYF